MKNLIIITTILLLGLSLNGQSVSYVKREPLKGAGHVSTKMRNGNWVLLRDGKPYYIKGIGGDVRLDLASKYGANSLRTWSTRNADAVLDSAASYGMTVLLGISLVQDPEKYKDSTYKEQKRTEVKGLVEKYKDHPALLMWALGNEINLKGTDTKEAWVFVEELAQIIRKADQNHPITTVIASGWAPYITFNNIALYAPSIEVLGINHYGDLKLIDHIVQKLFFKGPYMITEFGPDGHWLVPKTSWGRPIEQTSAEKVSSYQRHLNELDSMRALCVGYYIFHWTQHHEKTPTWYGMFAENNPELGLNGESCPTVDLMCHTWIGKYPENRAPVVTEIKLSGKKAMDNAILKPNVSVTAEVTVSDPENDNLTFIWELLIEPQMIESFGPRPIRSGNPVTNNKPSVQITTPEKGEYRLFVYVLDGKGHVGTANIPFLVE